MADPTDGSGEGSAPPARGASPYATGGGGVTLERRAAAVQLARLLTGATAGELRGRRVERVAFQQAPAHPVDDLVVTAIGDDGSDPLQLAIAVRRAPAFTTSDGDTSTLVGNLLTELRAARPGREHRVAVCVAGPQPAAQQVSQLAALASEQATAAGFIDLVRTSGRFKRAVVDRLDHLMNLVTAQLQAVGSDASPAAGETATWQLLTRLEVLMPRLEVPDESDWNDLLNDLQPWAREPTTTAALALRDRLEGLAAVYGPRAADVDLATLRRDAHAVLHLERRRATGWAELRRLDADARAAVRMSVGIDAAGAGLHLPRLAVVATVTKELHPGAPVVVTGESGVGKSSVVIGALATAAALEPASNDVVFLNLRLLPRTITEFRSALGAPPEELLREMSAANRVLVLDGADVILERDDQLLGPLARAALAAGVTPWAITATDGRGAVRAMLQSAAGEVREFAVPGLDDTELEEIAQAFPQLRRLIDEPRAKELLRRPAIADLFVRSGSSGLPLSEAHALDIVWQKLVRNNERTTRGLPDAREQVMRGLANQQLRHDDAAATYASLDAAALAGLQRDGLLRNPDRWQPVPTFGHDLLRTFSLARVLLAAGDPVGELLENGVPRWALPATRVAMQVLLSAPDNPTSPLTGRLARLQLSVDRLPEAGHGDRWADLPIEALLALPNAHDLLSDSWPELTAGGARGLAQLLRVTQQRHSHGGVIDRLVAEPVVELLLTHEWPEQLHDEVHKLLREWLRGLVIDREPAGHPLRIALRQRIVAKVAAGDAWVATVLREQEARRAARTPQEIAEDEERARRFEAIAPSSPGRRRRRSRLDLPRELRDDDLLEQLALLAADLGDDGAALLRRVAADAPNQLAPAVEQPFTGHGLATFDVQLLIDLADAYYLDDRDEDDGYSGLRDDGIRHHRSGPLLGPLAAAYRGPFLALLGADLPAGVAWLNRMLNHAARARVQILSRPRWGEPIEPGDHNVTELDITGDRRRYVGDSSVWMWYRGTGVGPFPCMSALQALEVVCDQYLAGGVPPGAMVRLLLDGCENLAIPALAVGMLIRHLERVGSDLDPFLSEPAVWHLEFARTTHESSGLAARTAGIIAPERRRWNLRDASARLALAADDDRADELRMIGRRLVARATELEGHPADSEELSEELAVVRGWAGSLDRDCYRTTETEHGSFIEQVPDATVAARLAASSAELIRGQQAMCIHMRYTERFDMHATQRPMGQAELLADVAIARDLMDSPPTLGPLGIYDAPAAVAAAALEAHFVNGIDVPDDDLTWSARVLVELMNKLADEGAEDDDEALFGHGPDHAAARGLPLLMHPAAEALRDLLTSDGITSARTSRAVSWIAESASNEARLFLTRAFDPLWSTACSSSGSTCHHAAALAIVEDTARRTLVGHWDQGQERNTRIPLIGPAGPQLEAAGDEELDVTHLSAAIRGAGAAAASTACCRTEAVTLLRATLAAHRRGMRASEYGDHHSATHALAAARAVLNLAAASDPTLLFEHLDDYSGQPRLLWEFLRALAAAGEETAERAEAARTQWPVVLDRIVEIAASGACDRSADYGEDVLAAAIPTPSYETGYLHREYHGDPIQWADPETLAPHIEQWLPVAAGNRHGVDALAQLLAQLPPERQATLGLPWMEQLVAADPAQVANQSYLLPNWLERVRPHLTDPTLGAAWHRIIDALTVAGDHRIAALAD